MASNRTIPNLDKEINDLTGQLNVCMVSEDICEIYDKIQKLKDERDALYEKLRHRDIQRLENM